VVGLRVRSVWVYGEEEKKRVFEGLVEVVEAELQHIDSAFEGYYDVKCVEAEVVDYNNYYRFTVKGKLGVYDMVREFYISKTSVEVITIPVEVKVDGGIVVTMARAQYFMVNGECYKYHVISYASIEDVAKAVIRETFLEEAKEVEESGKAGGSVF
jgi:hypothetical protein